MIIILYFFLYYFFAINNRVKLNNIRGKIMRFKVFKYSAMTIALTSLLTACGGGGGSSSNDSGTAAPFTPKTLASKAVDFYLAGATVQLDDCKTADGKPVLLTTGPNGEFTVTTSKDCTSSSLTITGGTDIGTNLPFTGTLKIKKIDLHTLSSNSLTVTPLTTLQAYAPTADMSLVLRNLGLSEATLNKLKASNFDLSNFNPITDANAQDMVIIFVIQQLANQIEDSMQTVHSADGSNALDVNQATALAFGAIVKQLQTGLLFEAGTAQINPVALQGILDSSVEEANKVITDPIDSSMLDKISTSTITVSTTLHTLVANGGNITATDLQNKLANNEGGIQDSLAVHLKTPVYSNFSFANYPLTALKNSSSASPLNIDLGALNNVLNINFNLNNAKTELSDSVKLAFKLAGQSGTQQETLNVTISNIIFKFNVDGSIKTATISAGTKVNIESTLAGVNKSSFTLNSNLDIMSANGSISLQNLIDSNNNLKNYYTQYVGKLRVGNTVNVSTYVLPNAYVIDSSLGLTAGTVDFGDQNFIGSNLTAYFKLN